MNDYIKQLEETNAKQALTIEELRKTNEEIVDKYNALVNKYNEAAGMLNACGVRGDSKSGWAVTMDIDMNVGGSYTYKVGNIDDPKGDLLAKGVNIDVNEKSVKSDGDVVIWTV
jgi:hypothetical protein